MMKKQLLLFVLLMGIALNTNAKSEDFSYSVDYIHGEGDVDGIKLAVRYNAGKLGYISDDIHIYWESSVNFWEYGTDDRHDSNLVLAISPVLTKQIASVGQYPLFVEAGIGVSFLDDTYFAGKNVSTHYQFEDRLGLMMKFGEDNAHQVSLRYFHYSNGGLKKPNPGLDFIALSYASRF